MSLLHFLKESIEDFIDLRTATAKAQSDGYIVDDPTSTLLNVKLSKVPKELTSPPMGNWKYDKGEPGELGKITLFEPTHKRSKRIDYRDRNGKTYNIVDFWRLETKDQMDARKAEDEKEKAEKHTYQTVYRPAQLAWMKKVYETAVAKLKRGQEITITTQTHMFPLSKPEHLKLTANGLMMQRGYKNGAPVFVNLTMDSVNQIASQVGAPPFR